MNERAQSRASQVPRYVSESAFTEEINARTKVGDTQDRRRLAILNLESGEAVWAGLDGVSDPIAIPKPPDGDEPRPAAKPDPAPKRDVRWGSPILSPDGRIAVVSVRSADNTERWLATIDPVKGTTKILDRVKDDAWVRDGGQGWLPDNKRVWFLGEHDGWMHLYTVDATTGQRQQLTSGKFEIDSVELSPDGRTFYIQSNEAHPGERHLYAMSVDGGPRTRLTTEAGGASRRDLSGQLDVWPGVFVREPSARSVRQGESRRRQADARHHEPFERVDGPQVGRTAAGDLQGARRRRRVCAVVYARDGGREARSEGAGGDLRARRRLPAERAQVLVELLPRIHVPSPAGRARLRGARSRLPRQRGLRPRLAHVDLSLDGRTRSQRRRRRRGVSGKSRTRSMRSASACMAAATAASSR